MKIAVVDDDYTARTLMSEFLEDEDHNVISAARPEELKNIADFDVVIIDVFIGADRHAGIEYVLKKREEEEIGSDVLVVFVSNFGRGSSEIERLLDQVGDFKWLDKPIEMVELAMIIQGVTGG